MEETLGADQGDTLMIPGGEGCARPSGRPTSLIGPPEEGGGGGPGGRGGMAGGGEAVSPSSSTISASSSSSSPQIISCPSEMGGGGPGGMGGSAWAPSVQPRSSIRLGGDRKGLLDAPWRWSWVPSVDEGPSGNTICI